MMPVIDVTVKPFNTSTVVVSLEWGHMVNGSFQSKGQVSRHSGLMALGKRTTEGQFGKASYTQTYHLDLPENCLLAIAARRRTGIGTTQVDLVYDILFIPEGEKHV